MTDLNARLSKDKVAQPLYRVVEVVDDEIKAKVTAGAPWLENYQFVWNEKRRVYDSLQQARMYRNRLRAQGRKGLIMRFVYQEVVDDE